MATNTAPSSTHAYKEAQTYLIERNKNLSISQTVQASNIKRNYIPIQSWEED